MEFVLVTGRRVYLTPLKGQHERKLLAAMKHDKEKFKAVTNALEACLVDSDPAIKNFGDLAIGEEDDLTLCLRLLSLGPLYRFQASCGNGHIRPYEVDLRLCERTIQTCSDRSCACHALRAQYCGDEKSRDTSWIRDGVLTADWDAIPANHLELAPPDYSCVLPVSGLPHTAQAMPVKKKVIAGRWAEELDPGLITLQLAASTARIGDCATPGPIERAIEDLTTADRTWLRERLRELEPGVDAEVTMTCDNCLNHFAQSLPLGIQAFLPKRTVMPPWFVSLLRSVLEDSTSRNLKSWIGTTRPGSST